MNIPNLENLFLMGNKIAEFSDIDCLKSFKKLKIIVMTNNPIVYKEKYRDRMIFMVRSLVLLDFIKVTKNERITA